MEYKVNYIPKFDVWGYVFRQTIRVKLTADSLEEFKQYVKELHERKELNVYEELYLNSVLNFGTNYPNTTTAKYFIKFFHLDSPRIKQDRNTCIIIER